MGFKQVDFDRLENVKVATIGTWCSVFAFFGSDRAVLAEHRTSNLECESGLPYQKTWICVAPSGCPDSAAYSLSLHSFDEAMIVGKNHAANTHHFFRFTVSY